MKLGGGRCGLYAGSMFQFPLDVRFKIMTLAPQIVVTDASGGEVCYIKQKAFKLKESVTVYRDATQSAVLGTISADRVLDFSARYIFQDAEGKPFGAVGRRGMKSLWRSHYDIFDKADSKTVAMTIEEESVLVRMLDGVAASVPVVGVFSGYLFHPSYAVKTADGRLVARLRKKAAFLEGAFQLEQHGELTNEQELEILLSCLMMTLLERQRG